MHFTTIKGQNEQKLLSTKSCNTKAGSSLLRHISFRQIKVVMYFSIQQAGNFPILLPQEVVEADSVCWVRNEFSKFTDNRSINGYLIGLGRLILLISQI